MELGNSKKWDYVYGLFDDKFNLYAEFLRLPQEAYNKSPKSAAYAFADVWMRGGAKEQPGAKYGDLAALAMGKTDKALNWHGFIDLYE